MSICLCVVVCEIGVQIGFTDHALFRWMSICLCVIVCEIGVQIGFTVCVVVCEIGVQIGFTDHTQTHKHTISIDVYLFVCGCV